jgi:citrate lyase beta subunit
MTGVEGLLAHLDRTLAASDAALAHEYPGERGSRQPVHTVYVPADRFGPDTVRDWGVSASRVLAEHGEPAAVFADNTGMDPDAVEDVLPRVRHKLMTEPVEDLRIDFEDGYGHRADDEEDRAAATAGRALAEAVADGAAPPYHGIRMKCLEPATRRRGVRTLETFVGELARGGGVGPGLRITLPKVTAVEQVEAMVTTCAWVEDAHGLPRGTLRFEVQVETPQCVVGADGTALVARMVHAADGRCTGLHYGTYDYSATIGIAAAYQSMEHPAADVAKAVMQVAAAGTGVHVSDGSTNVLPVGGPQGVRRGWTLHARLVRRSLERGFYGGWDLHPAQLPTRYAATYAFFRDGLEDAGGRLRAYVGRRETAYLDEPATARALAGFVLRGLDCGAVDEAEVVDLAGLDRARLEDLAGRRPPG